MLASAMQARVVPPFDYRASEVLFERYGTNDAE